MIDSHTHIFEEGFSEDLPEVLARACRAGVSHMVLPNIDLTSLDRLHSLHQNYPKQTSIAIGLHPSSVAHDYREQLEKLYHHVASLAPHSLVAIGEVGLDYYWDRTFYHEQQQALREQIGWALEYNLPLILHTRSAHTEMLELLSSYLSDKRLRGVFHSFTGTPEELEQLLSFSPNFYVGINGVVTFKKSILRDFIATIPLDRLLLETDAPYLAPVPHRGKRNEPAFLKNVRDEVARAYGVTPEVIDRQTSENAQRLFSLSLTL